MKKNKTLYYVKLQHCGEVLYIPVRYQYPDANYVLGYNLNINGLPVYNSLAELKANEEGYSYKRVLLKDVHPWTYRVLKERY